MGVFRTKKFNSSFSFTRLHYGNFLRWLGTIPVAAAIIICSAAKQKFASRPEGAIFVFFLGPVQNDVLREPVT